MKKYLIFLTSLILLFTVSKIAVANDVYLEYQITGLNGKTIISKIYAKNKDFRTDISVDLMGKPVTTTSLMLNSHPGTIISYNSMRRFYTETKKPANSADADFTVKVVGTEKVGKYNCIHVIMTSKGKSWDAWYTKELPSFDLRLSNIDALNTIKALATLKSKGVTGMVVKIVFLKPGSTTSSLTMQLVKYEQKPLSSALFTIPNGYTKSAANPDLEKMKKMTPEQQKKLLMEMMQGQKRKN